MKKNVTCLAAVLFSMTGHSQMYMADVSGITDKYPDVPYAAVSEARKLDIYLPNEGDGHFPE